MIKQIQKSLIALLIMAFPGIGTSATMKNHSENDQAQSQNKVLQCANKKALKRNLTGDIKEQGNINIKLLGNQTFSYLKGKPESFSISDNNGLKHPDEIIESHYLEDDKFLNFSIKVRRQGLGKSEWRYNYYQVMRTGDVVRHYQFITQNLDIKMSNDKRKMKSLLVNAAEKSTQANDNGLARYLYIFECGTREK